MQCIGLMLGKCGSEFLSTLPDRNTMFELFQLISTELLSATITATKCVDGWITAD